MVLLEVPFFHRYFLLLKGGRGDADEYGDVQGHYYSYANDLASVQEMTAIAGLWNDRRHLYYDYSWVPTRAENHVRLPLL